MVKQLLVTQKKSVNGVINIQELRLAFGVLLVLYGHILYAVGYYWALQAIQDEIDEYLGLK